MAKVVKNFRANFQRFNALTHAFIGSDQNTTEDAQLCFG